MKFSTLSFLPNVIRKNLLDTEVTLDNPNKLYSFIFTYISYAFETIGTIIFAYGSYTYFRKGLIIPASIEIAFYILTLSTILCKKINISYRRFAFILLMYITNVFTLIIAGPSGAGLVCLISFLILGGCILEEKQQNYLIVINLAVFAVLIIMLQTNMLNKYGIFGYKNTWIIVFSSAQVLGLFIMLVLRILLSVLFKQKETYKLILDSINEGVGLYKNDGTTLFLNKYILDTVNNELTIGKRIFDQTLTEYKKFALNRYNSFNKAVADGKKLVVEDTWNGHWYSNRLYPILKEGQVTLVTVITEDITDTKMSAAIKLETEILKAKEQEYLEIIDGSLISSWILDYDKNILRISNEWKKRIGCENTPEEKLLLFMDAAIHPDDLSECLQKRLDVFSNKQDRFKHEFRVKTINGDYIWVLEQGKITYENGFPIKIYGTTMDITDRKIAEENVRESEKKFLQAFYENPAGMTISGENGEFIDVNKSFLDMTGYSAENFLGKNSLELKLFDTPSHKDIIDLLLKSGDTGLKEAELYTSDGKKKFVLNQAKAFELSGKQRHISFSLDITERKKAEAYIHELLEQLKQDDINKNQFLNALSHELRNPLAAIVTGSVLLDMQEIQPKTRKIVEVIKRQSNQLCSLVDGLLDVTRITNNKMQLHKELFDINILAETVFQDLKIQFNEKGVDLKYIADEKPVHVFADNTRIVQIIGNLLVNSLKFTDPGGSTVLSLHQHDDKAYISVEDNGVGIATEFLPNLFEPFKQADNSPMRNKEGLGLGLAIVKGIAELHDGAVCAFSEGIGKGSRFTITLPLVR